MMPSAAGRLQVRRRLADASTFFVCSRVFNASIAARGGSSRSDSVTARGTGGTGPAEWISSDCTSTAGAGKVVRGTSLIEPDSSRVRVNAPFGNTAKILALGLDDRCWYNGGVWFGLGYNRRHIGATCFYLMVTGATQRIHFAVSDGLELDRRIDCTNRARRGCQCNGCWRRLDSNSLTVADALSCISKRTVAIRRPSLSQHLAVTPQRNQLADGVDALHCKWQWGSLSICVLVYGSGQFGGCIS